MLGEKKDAQTRTHANVRPTREPPFEAILGLDFFVKYHPRGNSNCRFLVVNFSFDPSTMPKIVEVAYVHFL